MRKNILKAILVLSIGGVALSSCKDKFPITREPPQELLKTTALYDTLGWFIQGGQGAVAGQGTKMIADPEDGSKQIQAGRLAIRTVIQRAEVVLASDPAMAPFFPTLLAEVAAGNTTGFIDLRETFTDFVQQAASGQEIYQGLDMVTAHNNAKFSRFGSPANPKANNVDFNLFLADVGKAMTQLNVPPSVQAQLGAVLEASRAQIVQQ